MSYFKNIAINTDNQTGDAFGRLRISDPQTIFDSKQLYDNGPLFWDDAEVSGAGTGTSHSTDTASSTISVGATTAGNRTRQTLMHFNYQPGKSQQILLTGVLQKTGGGAGITRGFGIGEDNNGLFLVDNEGAVQIVRRTSTSGTAVDNAVDQASWNIDVMDGTGPSGVTLDLSKANILVIDYEWLGVGRVRFGFNVDGVTHYCHQFLNANALSEVYMSTPNLPLRYWIENDGTGAASSLEQICATVISEGGQNKNGYILSENIGTSPINANAVGITYAVIGMRLKSTHLSATIQTIQCSLLGATADDFIWDLRCTPAVAGTFTYSDYTNSAIQTAIGDVVGNPSTNTVTGGTIMRSGYVHSGSAETLEIETAKLLGSQIDGTAETIVLCVTPITSNADIYGAVTWRELT